MMKRILIVEDSKSMLYFEQEQVKENLSIEADCAGSLAEAKAILEGHEDEFFIALLDLNLPDAPNGEVVDYVLEKGISVIVFTGSFSDEIREEIMKKDILDYVLKGEASNFDFVLRLIRYVQQNGEKKVLVVDDSKISRAYLSNLLEIQHYNVLEAKDASEALDVLREHPDIALMLTDYHMPGMSGSELVREVRKEFGYDKLVVIGVSSYGSHLTSVEFLKNGADDFLTKPFMEEEFLYRIMQSMLRLDYIRMTREFSIRDSLTGLYNHRHFFDMGEQYYENVMRGTSEPFSLAMVDIDFFKKVNDTYGHQTGDLVLKKLASMIFDSLRKADLLARYGGEEFCFLLSGTDKKQAERIMEKVRIAVEAMEMTSLDGRKFHIAISAGIADEMEGSFSRMIETADQRLYMAKKQGRNRIVTG